MSSVQQLLDAAGRRRSLATLSDLHAGGAPGNKGQRYAADPPTVDEIIAVVPRCARPVRESPQSADRSAVACRVADQRGTVADRDRSGGTARIGFGQAWQERSPSPGRDGRVGWTAYSDVLLCRRGAESPCRARILRSRSASGPPRRLRLPDAFSLATALAQQPGASDARRRATGASLAGSPRATSQSS